VDLTPEQAAGGTAANLTDEQRLAGYKNPIKRGVIAWFRALGPIARKLAPFSLLCVLVTTAWVYLVGDTGSARFNYLPLIITLIVLYGFAVIAVLMSGEYARNPVENPYLHALQRFVPWLVAWAMILGITLVGYVLLIFPGIYLNLRVFWADEYALVHNLGPFEALDESWKVTRDEAGTVFGVEFLLGFLAFPAFFAAIGIMTATASAASQLFESEQLSTIAMVAVASVVFPIAYAFTHASQVALLYGLKFKHAQRTDDVASKPMPWVLKGIAALSGAIVAFSLAYFVFTGTASVPSARVVAGADVTADQVQILIEIGALQESESIDYFFSEGLSSIREGGSLVTDMRVTSYQLDTELDVVEVWYLTYPEIGSVEQIQAGDSMNYSIYEVYSHDNESWLQLWLPHEYGDDELFISAVEARIREYQ